MSRRKRAIDYLKRVVIEPLAGPDYSKISQVEWFLRRIKQDLKKRKVCSPSPPQTRMPPSPLRKPTVHDRLGALADPELKAWVDEWDAREAALAESNRQASVAWEAERKLKEMPVAKNPEWEEYQRERGPGKLDMHYNPLACDEDFWIPERAA